MRDGLWPLPGESSPSSPPASFRWFLFVYSLGLGVPFVATGLLLTRVMAVSGWARRLGRRLEVASGAVLAAVGLLLVTNKIFYLSILAQDLFTLLGIDVTRFL